MALGGVEGRGFWLSGDVAVTYAMPDQGGVDDVAGYVGLFVDPRDSETRELIRFPDDTAIALTGSDTLTYLVGDVVVREIALPPTDGWMHLGWRLSPGHTGITLLHDGFVFRMVLQHEYQHNETILQTLQLKQGEPYPAQRQLAAPSPEPTAPEPGTMVRFPGGRIELGTDT